MSNIDQHDKEDMGALGAIGRAYQDARESDGMVPPPALDDAIRAAARRAVRAGPQPVGKTWIRKWTPQIAVAAVVVLSVSVVFVSVEERPDLAPPAVQEIALKRAAEAPAAAKTPKETKITEALSPAAPPLPPQMKFDAVGERNLVEKKAVLESPIVAAEPQVMRGKSASVAKQELSAPRMATPLASPPTPLAAAVTPVAPPVYAPPAPPVQSAPPASASAPAATARFVPPPEVQIATPVPFPGTGADTSGSKRKEARADAGATVVAAAERKPTEERIEVTGSRITAADALRSRDAADVVASAATNAAANTPAKPASPAVGSAIGTTTGVPVAQAPMMKQVMPAPAAPAPAITASAANAAPPARALESDFSRKNAQSSGTVGVRGFSKDDYKLADKLVADERPGPWLKRLQELREQGKLKELREGIARFQKRHPDVVLPKALTELPPE